MTAQKISLPQAFLSSLQISHFTVLLHFNGRRPAPVRCAGLLSDGPVIGRGNSGFLIGAAEGSNRQGRRVAATAKRRTGLPYHAFPVQDGFGHATGHDGVAVDEREEEAEVLLRAAEVVAERGPPLLAVRLQRVLEVRLLQRLLQRVGGEDRAPAVGIRSEE